MKRKRFSDEQIIRILTEAEREDTTVAQVCREHGVSENSYYRRRRRFGGMTVPELRRVRELEWENARLTRGHWRVSSSAWAERPADTTAPRHREDVRLPVAKIAVAAVL